MFLTWAQLLETAELPHLASCTEATPRYVLQLAHAALSELSICAGTIFHSHSLLQTTDLIASCHCRSSTQTTCHHPRSPQRSSKPSSKKSQPSSNNAMKLYQSPRRYVALSHTLSSCMVFPHSMSNVPIRQPVASYPPPSSPSPAPLNSTKAASHSTRSSPASHTRAGHPSTSRTTRDPRQKLCRG
jgi:hypothetical protein